MKNIIVEVKGKDAILLQGDGTFIKIRNKNFKVGDRVEVKDKMFNKKTILSLAASIIFMLILGSGVFAYNYPYYYVSLDVNPGIVLTSNVFNRVIGIEAVNEEGEKIIENLKIRNRAIEKVMEETILKLSQEYLQEENADLLISYVGRDNEITERRINKINELVEKVTEESKIRGNVTIQVIGYEMVQKAKEVGITPGKYNIISKLLNEEVTEENKDASIRDLMKRFTGKLETDKGKEKQWKQRGKW